MQLQHSHTIDELFQQLGLEHTDEAIEAFIESHKLKRDDGELYDAPFWSSSQAKFLEEAKAYDADWAEPVDELDARLRS
ncbi:DUF2789 domain-containing protein [Simiduia sp. 21SJ11W-1]|uniref:DUF2789 family protein n=1 Tax=Simiduia sp. 21SJ11W-1 TaxID=2909669 RepID=UPI0020A13AEC|nr:DUF2789 family protein [Simiduia sp. 21SJ11W-1]UTA49000.1 DUF2789 domain-containing protein [Simiduia sp. 21SJ11W-1]